MILLLVVALTLIILIRRAQRQPPHKRRAAYIQIILGSAVVGVVILTLMGKMHWIGAALTGALVFARQMLPLLIRILPMLGGLRGQNTSAAGKQSEVSSRILKMTLDHDSGDLSGVVLEGTYRDWLLEELDREQLDELMAFCQREDADSAQLLASYLEQRFPDEPGASDPAHARLHDRVLHAKQVAGTGVKRHRGPQGRGSRTCSTLPRQPQSSPARLRNGTTMPRGACGGEPLS